MAYLIDSHTHLHDREFFTEAQATAMLANAHRLGVEQLICIGTNVADSQAALRFAEANNGVFCSYGVHPEFAAQAAAPFTVTPSDKLVCIGEVGLDYHYPDYDKSSQWRLLEEMLQLAVELELPCSFHVREALPDFFSLVANFPKLKPSVLHSFSDSPESLALALDKGFYIGVNGLATFAHLDCYKNLTADFLDRALLETDAPFLTPVPKRGIINEPGYVKYVADYLAKKLGVSPDLVAEKTTHNVRQIFHLPDPGRSE